MPASVLAELAAGLQDVPTGLEALAQRGTSVTAYRAFLERAYGFHAPAEAMLRLAPGLRGVDLRVRARAGRIASDLLALGVRPAALTELPLCDAVPPFVSTEEGLGWLYALDRIMLAVPFVRAAMLRRVPARAVPTAFLASDGVEAEARWTDLCARIVRVATTPASQAVVVRGAMRAAQSHARWLDIPARERSPSYGSG